MKRDRSHLRSNSPQVHVKYNRTDCITRIAILIKENQNAERSSVDRLVMLVEDADENDNGL